MIHEDRLAPNQPRVLTALQFLEACPYKFYLTGSRFFGTQRADSDYDFFVQQSGDVLAALEQNGFKLDNESYERDPIMTRVYKRENVHVQVVINAKMKLCVQHRMKSFIQYHLIKMGQCVLSKEETKALWTLCTRLYTDGADGHAAGFIGTKG